MGSSIGAQPKHGPLTTAVEHRLFAFQERCEQLATPFEWKFTRADLRRLLARLERSPLVGSAA